MLLTVELLRAQGDNCSQALALSSIDDFCSSYAQFSNSNSTSGNYPMPSCWTGSPTEDVWFSFLNTETELLLAINGSGMMQPRIVLYSGSCNALVEVSGSCTNGTPGSSDSQIFCNNLVIGESYFLRVSTTQANEGSFQLCANNFAVPGTASADCSGAGQLCSKDPISVAGLNGGGNDISEVNGTCMGGIGLYETNSVWYTWTCAASGTLTFDITPANQSDDIDFSLFKLNNTADPCGSRTLIRCTATSCISSINSTGLNMTSTDVSEAPGCSSGQNRYVKYVDMVAGTSYALLINNAAGANGFTISWGGTGTFVGPVANITGGPFEACLGTPITFNGSTSANYDLLNWNFNDGGGNPSMANGPGPINVTYASPGNHTAILTAIDTSGCSVTKLANVTVWNLTNPSFTQIAPLCQGTVPPNLPVVSNNGINGIWSPSTINTALVGSTTYTFIPDTLECATTTTMTINVIAPVTPTFIQIPDFCEQTTAPVLPSSSTNSPSIQGSWSPALVSNTTNGTYTFTPNAGGCASTTSMTINLIPRVEPLFDQPAALCAGSIAPELPAMSNNNITGSWSPAMVNNITSGNYTFTPNTNECANQATVSITVNPLPVVSVSCNSPVCIGNEIQFSANTVTGGTYSWSGPTSFASNQEDPMISSAAVNNSGQYSLTITDANGCVGIGSTQVLVDQAVAPVLAPAGPFCSENTTAVTLNTDVPGGTWSGNGITNPNGEFTPAEAGLGIHTLSYTYTSGCGGTDSMEVQVLQPPGSDFGSNITDGCPPLTVNFISGTNADSAVWEVGTGETAIGIGGCSYTYESPGFYTITLTNYFDGCASTTTQENYIEVYETPTATFSESETQLDQSNTLVEFYNASTNAVTSTWNFGDNSPTTQETNPSHSFPVIPGSYLVELTVESGSGCIDKAYTTIVVKEYQLIYVPNSFTPNGDAFNNSFQPVLSEGFDLNDYELHVFNRWGEKVFETSSINEAWDGNYHGNRVPGGTYTWTIRVKSKFNAEVNRFTGHVSIVD